jgi:DNA-binding transcriptional LysR family regulator
VATFPAELSVPGALRRLLAAHPRLLVRVHVRDWQDLTSDVANDVVDLALGEISELEGGDRLETELVGAHRVPFVCRPGHPLRRKRRVSLDDVVAYPFAGVALPPRAAARFPRPPFAAGTVDPATGRLLPAIYVDRPLNVKDLLRETDAVAPLVRTMCAAELEDGALAVVPISLPWARTHYGFLWRRGRMRTPAATAFAEAVRAAEADAVSGEADLVRRFP